MTLPSIGLALALAALCLVGPARGAPEPKVASAPSACCCCGDLQAGAAPEPAHAASAGSVYEQLSSWETDSGMRMALSELRGRAAIVALFYTSCHVACPATLHELIDVERRLPADSKVAIVLVTIDPQTDTPAELAQCREENRLADRFILLRGSPAGIRAFADAAGILFRQEPARIVHVPKVVVLGKDGTVAASFPGTHSDTGDVARAALKAERSDTGS